MKKLLQVLGVIFLVLIVLGIVVGFVIKGASNQYKEAEEFCSAEGRKLLQQVIAEQPKGADGKVYMEDFGDFSDLEDYMINAYTKCMKDKGVPESMINLKKQF